MDVNYCGKDCAVCEYRSECRGCTALHHDCDIAQCCRQRGHASCETCVTKDRCGTLMRKDRKYEERRESARRVMLAAQENEARAAVMAPVLWKIFWLMVVTNILSVVIFIPALERMGNIFIHVMSTMIAGLLMTMKDVDRRFWTAGCCAVAAALLNLAVVLLGEGGLVTVLSLGASVFAWVALYYELNTMGEIVGWVDAILGKGWRNLWKYRMIALGAGIGCVLLALLAPVLAAVVLIGVAIAALVLGIMQMVYYYKTAKLFDGMIAK